MSTENGTIHKFEYDPPTITRGSFSLGIVLRLAFIGAWVSVLGVVALFNGDFAPITAIVLAVCGAGVAYASVRYLQRWDSTVTDAVATLPSALPAARNSMHQPV